MSMRRELSLIVPFLWTAHTLAGVLLVGVERTSFGRHKIEQGFVPTESWKAFIATHAILACVALLAGAVALREASFRKRFRTIHRRAGRTYALSVLGSGLLSAPLLPDASGGLAGQLGLTALLLSWFVSTGWAVWAIRQGRVAQHRRWMARSYALTFANLVLHLSQTLIMGAFRIDRENAYLSATWICTPLCLATAELIIRRSRSASEKKPAGLNSEATP